MDGWKEGSKEGRQKGRKGWGGKTTERRRGIWLDMAEDIRGGKEGRKNEGGEQQDGHIRKEGRKETCKKEGRIFFVGSCDTHVLQGRKERRKGRKEGRKGKEGREEREGRCDPHVL
jgi:hypothetical protein